MKHQTSVGRDLRSVRPAVAAANVGMVEPGGGDGGGDGEDDGGGEGEADGGGGGGGLGEDDGGGVGDDEGGGKGAGDASGGDGGRGIVGGTLSQPMRMADALHLSPLR